MQPKSLTITLSYDGEHLLYRAEEMDTHVIHTALYTDRETYRIDSDSKIAGIEPGFDFSRMLFCPLPGVGVPNRPFFFSGIPASVLPQLIEQSSPQLKTETQYIDKLLYETQGQSRDYGMFLNSDRDAASLNGSVHTGMGSVVSIPVQGNPKVLWYSTFDNTGPSPGGLWEYYDHKKFQGVWLATIMRMRVWNMNPQTRKNNLLQQAKYELKSAMDGALKPDAYDPVTYLQNYTSVTDSTVKPPKTFVYYVGKGSLSNQRGNALDVRRSLSRNMKPQTNTGLYGLIIVSVMTGIWFLWRRGRRTK